MLPFELKPGASRHVLMTVASDGDMARPSRAGFFAALKHSKREAWHHISAINRVETSNTAFDAWTHRAAADLSLLVTELETGPYPYAGIPWFSVPFGRDAVVTALQMLWINPSLARGVLAYLSALQAAESSAFQDAEPGKIMHESRKGEMAALREVPFGRYYGGADTTPPSCSSPAPISSAPTTWSFVARSGRDPRGSRLDRPFWRCRPRRFSRI